MKKQILFKNLIQIDFENLRRKEIDNNVYDKVDMTIWARVWIECNRNREFIHSAIISCCFIECFDVAYDRLEKYDD